MPDRIIANSELRGWQSCRRRWYLSYCLGYAPDPATEPAAGVMHLGSRVHLALEAYYGYGDDPIRALDVLYWHDAITQHPGEAEALEKEWKLAVTMVEGYLDWVGSEGIDAGVEIIGTEVAVEHQVTDPGSGKVVTLRGRLDQLARRESDGALIARDLKTVGTLGKAQVLRISSQLKFYALVQALSARAGGGDIVAGGEYLMLLRSKRTARATPPFYDRVEVPVNRHELNSQWLMTMELVREIEEARRRLAAGEDHHKVAYPHFTDACSWGCPFLQVCGIMDDGSRWEDMLKANFVRQDSLSYYSSDRIRMLRAALADQ